MKYVTMIHDRQYEIEIGKEGEVTVNGEPRHVDFLNLGPSLYSLITDNHSFQVVVEGESGRYDVLMNGHLYETQVMDERALLMAQRRGGLVSGSGEVNSPMPGLIVGVLVEAGQSVEAGQTVVILESMKMQNELKTPVSGIVESVSCEVGQTVDKNTRLVVVQPPEA
ncbi:MAG: biotin/lipoyl-binding protein [Anaerolineae bacterium]|nr:biotin/lipoyl-binding protein [Anaerolineae bacterium]